MRGNRTVSSLSIGTLLPLSVLIQKHTKKMDFLDTEATDVSVCNDEGSSSGDKSPTDNSSSDSESDSIPARPMVVSSKKARRRRLSYSDCEANSDGESRKKNKSAKHTHVTSHSHVTDTCAITKEPKMC